MAIGRDGFPDDWSEEDKDAYRKDFGEPPEWAQEQAREQSGYNDAKQRFNEAKAASHAPKKSVSKTAAKAKAKTDAMRQKQIMAAYAREMKPIQAIASGFPSMVSEFSGTQMSKRPFSFFDSHGKGIYGGVGAVSRGMGSSLGVIGSHGVERGLGIGEGLHVGISICNRKRKT